MPPLHTFFQKFDLFADAPDSVAKMRELVLELAVQGKLVQQMPTELSARDCIRKANKPLIEVALDETIEAPSGWVALPLGCLIAANTGGGTPSKQNPDYWNGPIPWASVKDVQSEKYLNSTIDSITEEGLKNSSSNLIPPNRLIVVTRMGLGKLAINTISVAINQDLRAIKPTTALDLDFAYLLFKSLKMVGSGVTVKGITMDRLHAMSVLLPPLAEQKRIVAKVDELMALCDRLEAQQQEREEKKSALARASLARFADAPTPANLNILFYPQPPSGSAISSFTISSPKALATGDHPSSFLIPPSDLRKSILTLAVQGKLVPQDPNDEPAEEILARLAATKLRLQRTGDFGKEKPVEPLQPDSLPFGIPDSWRWAKLAELTELITKGSSPKWQGIAYVPESEGVLFITSENVGNYVLRKLDNLKYVSKRFNEIEPRSILKRGDILMNLVGASIGRTAVYDLHDGANINQAVALIRLVRETDGICPRFLLHYMNSPAAIAYMISSRVVNAQPNISLTDAREFAVPIPPLAEQRRIVGKVEQLMALVDELEMQLAKSHDVAGNLLDAVVTELTIKER